MKLVKAAGHFRKQIYRDYITNISGNIYRLPMRIGKDTNSASQFPDMILSIMNIHRVIRKAGLGGNCLQRPLCRTADLNRALRQHICIFVYRAADLVKQFMKSNKILSPDIPMRLLGG